MPTCSVCLCVIDPHSAKKLRFRTPPGPLTSQATKRPAISAYGHDAGLGSHLTASRPVLRVVSTTSAMTRCSRRTSSGPNDGAVWASSMPRWLRRRGGQTYKKGVRSTEGRHQPCSRVLLPPQPLHSRTFLPLLIITMSDTGRQSLTDKASAAMKVRSSPSTCCEMHALLTADCLF